MAATAATAREPSWHGTTSKSVPCGGGSNVERTRFRRTRGLAEQDEDGCGATITTTASSGSFSRRSLAEPVRPPQEQQQPHQGRREALVTRTEAFDRDVCGGGLEVCANAPLVQWHVHAYYDETHTLLFQVQQLPSRGPCSSSLLAPSQVILSCEEIGSYVRQLLRVGGGGGADVGDEPTRCSVRVTSDSNCGHHPLVQCLVSWTGEAAAATELGQPPSLAAITTRTRDDTITRDEASSVALSSSSSSSQRSDGGKTRSTQGVYSNVSAVGRWRRWLVPRWSLSTPAMLLSAAGSSGLQSVAAPSFSVQQLVETAKIRRTTSSDTQAATADETVLLQDRVPSFVDHPHPAVAHDDNLAGHRASAALMASDPVDYPKETIRSVAQSSHRTAPATFAAATKRSAFRPPAAAGRPQALDAAHGGGFRGVQNQDQGVWI
jgi:hypothetical protein